MVSFKTTYTDADGNISPTFKNINVFLFFQSLFAFIISMIVKYSIGKRGNKIPYKQQMIMGFYNMTSLILGNTAYNHIISIFIILFRLLYVSYPLQALIKSAKILSVLLASLLNGSKKFKFSEILSAALITFGIMLFNFNVNLLHFLIIKRMAKKAHNRIQVYLDCFYWQSPYYVMDFYPINKVS
jgi:drug/metabolite transporter (DMT)-like permease